MPVKIRYAYAFERLMFYDLFWFECGLWCLLYIYGVPIFYIYINFFSDDKEFHQYQKNEQPPRTPTPLT